MSTHDQTHEGSHHIMPIRTYLMVAAALFTLTVITVAVAQVDFGPWNLVVAMIVATSKAVLVALFFMHLFYDNKLYGAFFTGSLVFLGIFIITMYDTMRRDSIYPEVGRPIRESAVIYGDDGMPLKKNAHGGDHGEAAMEHEGDGAAAMEGDSSHAEQPTEEEAAAGH